ncbi:ABC transporter permease [Fodinicurvata sp. EGI_FJ10296]|uniref:ABC transporter permease n=1 Tax=Fodinicurvata sp. EGI_FJ10296 TaxID=3231908 RepID=UPI00345711BC
MFAILTGRLLQSLALLFVMSVAIYYLMGLMPGDPIDIMINADPSLSPADAAHLRELYGLDQPIWRRYGNWLAAALQGDLGYSRLYNQPVPDILFPRVGNTLVLLGAAMIIAVLIAFPVGLLAAIRPYSRLDTVINLACFAGISMPVFWLALMLIILFSVLLGWFPAGGFGTAGGSGGIADRLTYLVLPVATLVIISVGSYTRFIRASMMEQLRADYIRTAVAKGVSRVSVVWNHALRNAAIPIVTVIAVDLGTLFGGALITETMFSFPGMGRLIYDSIMGNDYNLALVGLLVATLMTIVGNLMADIAYAIIDPRIRFGDQSL